MDKEFVVLRTLFRAWRTLEQRSLIEPYPSLFFASELSVTHSPRENRVGGCPLQCTAQTLEDTLLWTSKPLQGLSEAHTKIWDFEISREDIFFF